MASCFKYGKLHKGWQRGKPPPSVTFSEDRRVCVLSTLKSYLGQTKDWRKEENQSQLLLSFITPHKPVRSDTIS